MSFGSAFSKAEGISQLTFIISIFRNIDLFAYNNIEFGESTSAAYCNNISRPFYRCGFYILPPFNSNLDYKEFSSASPASLMREISTEACKCEIIGRYKIQEFLRSIKMEKDNFHIKQYVHFYANILFEFYEQEIRNLISTGVKNSIHLGENFDKDVGFYQVCKFLLSIPSLFSAREKEEEKEEEERKEKEKVEELKKTSSFIIGKYLLHVRKLIILVTRKESREKCQLMTDDQIYDLWKLFQELLVYFDNFSLSPGDDDKEKEKDVGRRSHSYQNLFKLSENIVKEINKKLLENNLIQPLIEIIISFINDNDESVEQKLKTCPFFLVDKPNFSKKFDQKLR